MRGRGGTAALSALVVALLAAAPVRAERAFAPRFTANAQGDVAIAANTALSCISVDAACPAIRDGTAPGNTLNNNTTLMSYVDVDSDPDTFDSSTAALALPAGGHVLFAGLYWGARTKAGIGGTAAPDPSARGRVLLRAPGSDTYTSVTAAQVDDAGDIYQGFADVTAAVRDAGGGDYTVADLQAGTGRNDAQLAGWSLVVAYGDQAAPPRNLAVFDGLQNVSTTLTAPVTVALSGFQTPASGTVRSRVGIVAYEGDRNTTGDGVTLRGPAGDVGLPQGAPSNNVFRSAITTDGDRRQAAQPRLRQPARLRRPPARHHQPARQRADLHSGQAQHEGRRLPARRGDARHRPARAAHHRDQDGGQARRRARRRADLHDHDPQQRARTRRPASSSATTSRPASRSSPAR